MNRLVIVPDEKSEALAFQLRNRLVALASEIEPEYLAGLMDEQCRRVLVGFSRKKAQEVLLWGRSEGAFRVAWTSLAPESEVLNIVTAAPNEGLLSRVSASGHSVALAGEELQASAWTNLEERRGRALESLTASPVYLFHKCAGVFTLGRYRTEETAEPGSVTNVEETAEVEEATLLVARLLEDRLIRACLGMESL